MTLLQCVLIRGGNTLLAVSPELIKVHSKNQIGYLLVLAKA
jgi:hypothetical protein